MTTVHNMSDLTHLQTYSIGPREAVMAAYAQSRGDFNTWNYETKYGALVEESPNFYFCGDFSAKKET